MPILTGVIASGISGNLTLPWSPEGGFDSLATVTVPSGGTSSVTFMGISPNYKHLQIRVSNSIGANIRFNGDTTATNYRYHAFYGTGTALVSTTANDGYAPADGSNGTTTEIIDIFDYASNSKFKTAKSLGGWEGNGSGLIWLSDNMWMNTAPITSITFSAAGIPQNSSFALYGVK